MTMKRLEFGVRSTATAAIVFVAIQCQPASAFTVPLSLRTQPRECRKRTVHRLPSFSSDLETQDEATSKTYDPSRAFTDDESPLLSDLLPESPTAADDNDILLDLDGNPLSPHYLADHMGLDRRDVTSYTCHDAFRGFMSNGCRVQLLPQGQTAFYKRIDFDQLDHAQTKLKTAPFKLLRDTKSYLVVANFLQSQARTLWTQTTGVVIPQCYHAQQRPNLEEPWHSKFSFLLEDLAPTMGWYQRWLLIQPDECRAALTLYAQLHAYFWNGSNFWKHHIEAATELEQAVWPSGSYVQPQMQNWKQCDIVAEEWAKKRIPFQQHLASQEYWDDLGERLQSVAVECARLAHPFADDSSISSKYAHLRTFTHGDPKQANLLFRRSDPTLQVGMIDFQWAGFGLAATDLAHFLTSAVHADLLVDGGEERLLQYYWNELQKYRLEYGATDQFSLEDFREQYETAVVDICRLMIAYTWSRFEQAVEPDDEEGCARTMNKTSYNKSIPNVVWLLGRCHEIMKRRFGV